MIFVLTFSSAISAKEFTDIDKHWAKHSIEYVASQGYFKGTSDTEFSPDMSMTRGMFVTVLSRMSGINPNDYSEQVFTDVKKSDFFYYAVNWAYDNNIVSGTGYGKFSPTDLITREQICLILENYLAFIGKTPEVKNEVKKYADNSSISGWAYDAVYSMQKYGYLVGGSNNQFLPLNHATRAECAAVLSRLDGYFFSSYNEEEPSIDSSVNASRTLLGDFRSSFYCPCSRCGSGTGYTASGELAVPGITVAVDKNLIPLGTKLYIEFDEPRLQELNGIYIAQDTGSAIKGFDVDILVDSHKLALNYGIGVAKVYIVNE